MLWWGIGRGEDWSDWFSNELNMDPQLSAIGGKKIPVVSNEFACLDFVGDYASSCACRLRFDNFKICQP